MRHEQNRIAAPISRFSLRKLRPHALRIVDEIHSLSANARLSIRDAFQPSIP